MWGGGSSDTWEIQWWSVCTSSLHHLWGNKPHLTFHRQVRRRWLNFHFVGWTVPLKITPQKQPVVSLMVCLLQVKLILFHYQLNVSCRSFKWARGSLNATESRDSQHLYLTYLLAQPSGMNCSSFLPGRAQRARERRPVSRARFTATGGQTSLCLEGVNLPALPTRQARPCINTQPGDSLHHTAPHSCFSYCTHWGSTQRRKRRKKKRKKKRKKMPLQSTLSGRGSKRAEDTQSDGKSFEQLRSECLQSGVLFEDPDFPATDSSLFFSQSVPVNIEWKRPKVCRNITSSGYQCQDALIQPAAGKLSRLW